VNLRKKTILFLVLLSPTLLFGQQENLNERIFNSLITLYYLPSLSSIIKKTRNKREPEKAPEEFQNFALDYFDKITANGNFLQKALARYKKKAGYLTVYEKCECCMQSGSRAEYNPFIGGINLNSASLKKENIEHLKNIIRHEVEHAKQDTILFFPILLPWFKRKYMAEKERVKNLFKFEKNQKLIDNELNIIFEEFIKLEEKFAVPEEYPYILGRLDGALESSSFEKITSPFRTKLLEREIEKRGQDWYKKNKKTVDNILDSSLEPFKNQKPAKNWRQRYKQYKKEFPTVWKPRVPVIEG